MTGAFEIIKKMTVDKRESTQGGLELPAFADFQLDRKATRYHCAIGPDYNHQLIELMPIMSSNWASKPLLIPIRFL